MFSRRGDDEDHLYDFNAAPGNLAAPGAAIGGTGRAPMTAYRGAVGAPLQSSMGRANNAAAPGSRMGLTTAQGKLRLAHWNTNVFYILSPFLYSICSICYW